jgi:hypothetical protein
VDTVLRIRNGVTEIILERMSPLVSLIFTSLLGLHLVFLVSTGLFKCPWSGLYFKTSRDLETLETIGDWEDQKRPGRVIVCFHLEKQAVLAQ